jgi:hypothetical protein
LKDSSFTPKDELIQPVARKFGRFSPGRGCRMTDKKNIDIITWENFDIEDLQNLAIRPIKSLAKAIVRFTDNADDADRYNLCEILYERMVELENCLKRLNDEKHAA